MDHALQILLLLAATRLRRPKSEEDNDDDNDEDPTVRAVRTRKSIKAAESEEGVMKPGQMLKKRMIETIVLARQNPSQRSNGGRVGARRLIMRSWWGVMSWNERTLFR